MTATTASDPSGRQGPSGRQDRAGRQDPGAGRGPGGEQDPGAGRELALPAGLSEVGRSQAGLRAFLHGLPPVDEVGARRRAAMLATRSVKGPTKRWAIDLAISMVDLTTLEGADTPGRVRSLCAKARRPDPTDPSCPPVAAVCVYPSMVPVAAEALGDDGDPGPDGPPAGGVPHPTGARVRLASVATAFPSGQVPLDIRLAEVRAAVSAGADEIDMVINRGAFLSGRYAAVFAEIVEVKRACGDAHLKVILETGELVTYDNVRRASWLAMLAGADFIKTSTGKLPVAATPPVTLVMLEAVRDFLTATGRRVGVKPAGGIRTTKDAIRYLVLVDETAGGGWLDPRWFRFGASTLLGDLLMQRDRQATGRYSSPDRVSVD